MGVKPQMVHFLIFFLSSHQVVPFAEGLSHTLRPNTLPSATIGHIAGQEEMVGVTGCDCSL